MDDVKRCSMCKTISSKSNFHKDIRKNDGYRSSCKFCSKIYYYNNQIRILNNHKIYNENNRSKINAYERHKRRTDFKFNLFRNIRQRTKYSFKSQNIEKSIKLLGCSNHFFRKWIIHQLYGIMTIENYGKIWSLDHCLPLSKINLSIENEMKKYTNWVNIRPMYIKDNIIKSDKINHHRYLLQEVKAKYFLKLNVQEE